MPTMSVHETVEENDEDMGSGEGEEEEQEEAKVEDGEKSGSRSKRSQRHMQDSEEFSQQPSGMLAV